MTLEAILKEERLAQKRSVEDVAAEVEAHPNTIRYAENGRSKIALSTFQIWARVLGYDVILRPKATTPTTPTPTAEAQA